MLLGDYTASQALAEELHREVARVLSLGPVAVRNRLSDVRGNTLVRNVFAERWPARATEIGDATVAAARDAGLRDEIAAVTKMSAAGVTKRLRTANGNTLVRNCFSLEWPQSPRTLADFSRSTVRDVRSDPSAIALLVRLLGQPDGRVRRLLGAALNGAVLRDVLRDIWPGDAPKRVLTTSDLVGRRYRLQGKEAGEGGQGIAYRAIDEQLDRPHIVIVKFGKGPEARASMQREYRIGRRASHPHVCQYHTLDVDPKRGTFLIIADGGMAVRDKLVDGPFPLPRAIELTRQIAEALDHLHRTALPILHCDVSPGNVLVDARGHARLADFGIAREGEHVGSGPGTVIANSTRNGGCHPCYSAPELLHDDSPVRASDQYSLALVLYTLLSGKVLRRRVADSSALACSARVHAAIDRALAENPRKRFPNCLDFAHALIA